jgi:hypothetical protein
MTTQPYRSDTDGSRDDAFEPPRRDDRGATDPLTVPASGQDQYPPTGQDQYSAGQDRHAGTDAEGLPTHRPEGSTGVTDAVEQPHARENESSDDSTHGSLFAEAELTGLRARWTDVQARFVDDPRKCVQMADGLVADVVQQLTNGFSHARSDLEDQWARGEDVSTEDLRQALKRYRQFFERMLSV